MAAVDVPQQGQLVQVRERRRPRFRALSRVPYHRRALRSRLSVVVAACVVLALAGGASSAAPADGLRVPEDVRSISYFPARGGWTLMWTRFDADAIDRDLARIASLRANTVRVIVPARAFGYPVPDAAMSGRLERVVGLAAHHGLRVELTLFDWWHDYGDISGSRRWAASLLPRYAGDERIAFVELKNELRPQDEGAGDWASALIPYVRELTRKPVTISVPALDAARDLRLLRSALGTAQPDFYSAHFYWRPELAPGHLSAAAAAVAPHPLRVAETGYSTAIPYDILPGVPPTPSAREAQQAYYLRSLALVARRLGLPPIAPWVLSDFAPDAIPPDDPGLYGNRREYRFGLFRVSGEAKPASTDRRRLGPDLRRGRRNGAGRRIRDRPARSGRTAGGPLDSDGIRARGVALRPRSHRAPLVRARRAHGRRRALGSAPLRHPRLAAAARERDSARGRGLRRPLSARRRHRRPRLVRRRRL